MVSISKLHKKGWCCPIRISSWLRRHRGDMRLARAVSTTVASTTLTSAGKSRRSIHSGQCHTTHARQIALLPALVAAVSSSSSSPRPARNVKSKMAHVR